MYVGIRVPIFVVVVARLGCPIIFLIFAIRVHKNYLEVEVLQL